MADDVKKFEVDLNFNYDYTEEANRNAINEVIKAGFGFGTNITNTIGNRQTAILDYDKIEKDNLVEINSEAKGKTIDLEGSSYTKVTEKINNEFGLKMDKGESFSNTLRSATNNLMENTDNYEYGIRIFLGKVMGVTLKPVNNLRSYLLKSALDDIDGMPVNGKISYPTDEKSLKRLFDAYGTHVITKAIFGCSYQYYYLRESINQETSLHTQVNCNISGKFSEDKKGLGGLNVNTDEQYDSTYTSCAENTSKKEKILTVGGGKLSGSFADWENGMDFLHPDTIGLIGYVWGGDSNTAGLVPLWELVANSERANLMKKAYDAYVNEHFQPLKKSKVVIVDVYGRYFGKGESAPETIKMTDYTGKTRKFKRLNEEIIQHVKGSKKGSFYFYYTTDFSTAGGLSEIKFDNRKHTYDSPWEKRGNHANEGVNGCLDDNVVLIKPANRANYKTQEDYEKDVISGFGVDVEGSKRVSEGATTDLHWVTGGCDWYKGLSHDKVHCIYTKDTLKE